MGGVYNGAHQVRERAIDAFVREGCLHLGAPEACAVCTSLCTFVWNGKYVPMCLVLPLIRSYRPVLTS